VTGVTATRGENDTPHDAHGDCAKRDVGLWDFSLVVLCCRSQRNGLKRVARRGMPRLVCMHVLAMCSLVGRHAAPRG